MDAIDLTSVWLANQKKMETEQCSTFHKQAYKDNSFIVKFWIIWKLGPYEEPCVILFSKEPCNSREVSIEYLQRVLLANRGRLLLRTPGLVRFGACICCNVDTIHSWACHVYGPLSSEHLEVGQKLLHILSFLRRVLIAKYCSVLYFCLPSLQRSSSLAGEGSK